MVVLTKQGFTTHLEIEGRPPIPIVCHVQAAFRNDGSLAVEGEAEVAEDLTSMIGVCGRINIGIGRRKVGVRIAATDPENGIVRFLIRTPQDDG